MHHRKQTKVVLALVFFTVVLLNCGPLWAQDSATPCQTETIIDDYTKVVSACDGTVTVFFRDDFNSPWVEAQPQQGYICICELNQDTGLPYSCDLRDSTANVKCYPIKQAGAGTTGCQVSENPRTYLYGGDAYTSNR